MAQIMNKRLLVEPAFDKLQINREKGLLHEDEGKFKEDYTPSAP